MSSPNHAELRSSLQVLTSYVQSDKETKQRKRFQNEGSEVDLACSFHAFGTPKARCSPEPPMFEPLLLANSYTHTLRPVRSRASTSAKETRTASRAFSASLFDGLVARSEQLFLWVWPYLLCRFISWWVGHVVRHAYKFGSWLSADSAGCSLGRFSHWWRSVWVSVFGEGGFHTSVALASTVLLGRSE